MLKKTTHTVHNHLIECPITENSEKSDKIFTFPWTKNVTNRMIMTCLYKLGLWLCSNICLLLYFPTNFVCINAKIKFVGPFHPLSLIEMSKILYNHMPTKVKAHCKSHSSAKRAIDIVIFADCTAAVSSADSVQLDQTL